MKTTSTEQTITIADTLAAADELERRADLLHSSLLASSLKEIAMRQDVADLRRKAAEAA
jgi:hypothetical protein